MLIIENGTVFTPDPIGRAAIVIAGGRIEKIASSIDRDAVRAFDAEIIDASDCIVTPGLVDPHVHLIGGSGEQGFASATPALTADDLIAAGITTVVGLLGTDTTTRTLPALLAKVKALREAGLNAWMWTGGYDARPLTGSIRDDVVLIEEIIGAGEIAIADRRASHFDAQALARLASDCYVGGTLTGKAGVLHLHTGELPERLSIVRDLLDRGVPAAALHPTHVNRNHALLKEAAELTRRGVPVDLDVVERNLDEWLTAFDGDRTLVTLSTDAPIGRPSSLLEQLIACDLGKTLPLATRNPARILKLHDAGELAPGKRADLLLLDARTHELRNIIIKGRLA